MLFRHTQSQTLISLCFYPVMSLSSDAISSVLRWSSTGVVERAGHHHHCSLVHGPHVPHQAACWYLDAGQSWTLLHHQPYGERQYTLWAKLRLSLVQTFSAKYILFCTADF